VVQSDCHSHETPRRPRIVAGDVFIVLVALTAALLASCSGEAGPSEGAITATTPATPTPLPGPPTLTPTPTIIPTLEPYAHTVQSGETGLYILTLYGYTSLDIIPEVLALNNLASLDNLTVGQVLLIPQQTPIPAPTPSPLPPGVTLQPTSADTTSTPPPPTEDPNRDYSGCSPENRCVSSSGQYWMHEVRAGDTIIGIAYQYDSSVTCVMRDNGLTEDTPIHEGQILRVCILATLTPTLTPTGGPDSTATPTPTLSPPLLLAPGDGAQVSRNRSAVLQWASVRLLEDNQYYLVIVRNTASDEEYRYTTRDNILRLPDALRPGLGQSATYEWRVVIVTGSNPDSAPVISGEGLAWQFLWQ
jgi:LysM repeat protein